MIFVPYLVAQCTPSFSITMRVSMLLDAIAERKCHSPNIWTPKRGNTASNTTLAYNYIIVTTEEASIPPKLHRENALAPRALAAYMG